MACSSPTNSLNARSRPSAQSTGAISVSELLSRCQRHRRPRGLSLTTISARVPHWCYVGKGELVG